MQSFLRTVEGVSMSAALRHAEQAVHEANDLVPPPMQLWLFTYYTDNDCRGVTLNIAAGMQV